MPLFSPYLSVSPNCIFPLVSFNLALQSLGGEKGGGGKRRAAGQAWLSPVLNYSSTISLLLPGLRGAEVRRGSFPLGYELFGQIFVV